MPRKRGSLDPAYLEMSLILRVQYDYIPRDVPRLSDNDTKKSIPERFMDRTMLDDVKVLDYVPNEDPDGDEDDRDQCAEWVLPGPVRPEPTSHEGEEAAARNEGGRQVGRIKRPQPEAVDASGSTQDGRGLLFKSGLCLQLSYIIASEAQP